MSCHELENMGEMRQMPRLERALGSFFVVIHPGTALWCPGIYICAGCAKINKQGLPCVGHVGPCYQTGVQHGTLEGAYTLGISELRRAEPSHSLPAVTCSGIRNHENHEHCIPQHKHLELFSLLRRYLGIPELHFLGIPSCRNAGSS